MVAVYEGGRNQLRIKNALVLAQQRGLPPWVEVDVEKMEGRFKEVPGRPDLPQDISEQLVVELYSK
jgi:small subunit ribosomal protein S4